MLLIAFCSTLCDGESYLDMEDLAQSQLVIDAVGTQGPIAEQIIEAGADYVLALKANQPSALQAVSAHFKEAESVDLKSLRQRKV